ncbi:MAG: hypothetical protein NXI31_20185 [bacterium]|nr:hypothetical protein [bacterium]
MIELAEICRIGSAYLKTGKRDGRKLIAAVELFRSPDAPSIDDLVAAVGATEGCVDGWLQWSDDKKWSPSWYFSDYGENMFVVGLAAGEDSHEHVFDDPTVACAHFIVKDIEDYGRILDARRKSS